MSTLLDYALTTVADVKESLGIDSGDNSKNNLIIRKINQATEMIERYTGRRFKTTTYTNEEYDATGIDQLILRQRPIHTDEAFSLSWRNSSQNEDQWEVSETEYYFSDANAGVVDGNFNFGGRWNRFRVTYTAGYDTIPADIAEAAATLAGFLVENGAAGTNVKSKTEGQRKIEYQDQGMQGAMSLFEQLGIDDILNPYRNYPIMDNRWNVSIILRQSRNHNLPQP